MISAGILLVFVISVYIFSCFYIKSSCNEARVLLDECEQSYSDGKNAEKGAEALKKLWDSKESPLSVFVNHGSIDDIELAIGELCVYSTSDEENDFLERIMTVRTLLHQIEEDTAVTVHSIF